MAKQTDGERKKRRPSIYLSEPLQRVEDRLRERQTLSGRLAQMAERYELVCSQVPELSDVEKDQMGAALSGTFIEPLLIKHLDSELEDLGATDLAARVRDMSYGERVAIIESLGR